MSRVETYDGPAWRLISTLCGESATRNLANHSMRIQDLYVGTVPIPQFIKKKSPCLDLVFFLFSNLLEIKGQTR